MPSFECKSLLKTLAVLQKRYQHDSDNPLYQLSPKKNAGIAKLPKMPVGDSNEVWLDSECSSVVDRKNGNLSLTYLNNNPSLEHAIIHNSGVWL